MKSLARILGALTLFAAACFAQLPIPQNASPVSHQGGTYYAAGFATWSGRVISGNSTTGSASIIIAGSAGGGAGGLQLQDGTTLPFQTVFSTLTPIIVDFGQGAQETVTPTAVSVGTCPAGNLGVGGSMQCATVTATFANTHGQSAVVIDGSFGLQTALNYAQQIGGGTIVIDGVWSTMGGTTAMITSAVPFSNNVIEDLRTIQAQYWIARPSTTTFMATPATLTATTVGFGLNGANTTGGTYTGASTYFVCVAYVDIAGNEGACSATFSGLTAGSGSTNQIGFSAPAASTGAVGYTVYISLAGGSYPLAYQVPLTSSVCTLTKLETVTPACALANTTYGQSGSAAIVSALTVNTSPIALQLAGVGNQLGTGVVNAHTTYAFAPGSPAVLSASLPFTTTAGPWASATPVPMGTIAIPAGFMNQVGRTIRVCGKYTVTPNAAATIENLQIYWDGAGSDAAGSPVQIANIQGTAAYTAVIYNGSFCETFTTTVSGAGVTAGSIIGGSSLSAVGIASAPTNLVTELDTKNAATASLNLAGGAGFTTRLHIVQNHTTGADTQAQLLNVTVEVL